LCSVQISWPIRNSFEIQFRKTAWGGSNNNKKYILILNVVGPEHILFNNIETVMGWAVQGIGSNAKVPKSV